VTQQAQTATTRPSGTCSKAAIGPASNQCPMNFDKGRAHLPTWCKCRKGIDVAEGGGEERATGIYTGTPDVFLSCASQDSPLLNAPEIDPVSAVTALTLLAGSLLVFRGRREMPMMSSWKPGAMCSSNKKLLILLALRDGT
jgi:hypothetical protein